MTPSHRKRFLFVWGMPLFFAVLSVFGLLAALLGTGAWHWASWISLGWLVTVMIRFWAWPREPDRDDFGR